MADRPRDRDTKPASEQEPEDDDLYDIADAPEPATEPPREKPSYESPVTPVTEPKDEEPSGQGPGEGEVAIEAPAEKPEPKPKPKPKPESKKRRDAPEPPEDTVHCHNHTETVGKWWCPQCNAPVCRECVKISDDRKARRPVAFCLEHDVACKINRDARKRDMDDTSPFTERIGKASAYPLRHHGWLPLVVITGIVGIIFWLGVAFPYVPYVGLALLALVLIPWMVEIVAHSARGSKVMPSAIVSQDPMQALVPPLLLVGFAGLAAFGPAALIYFLSPEGFLGGIGTLVALALAIIGFVLFPLAVLSNTVFESPLGVRPDLIGQALSRLGGDYGVLLFLFLLMPMPAVVGWLALDDAELASNHIPLIMVVTFVQLYALATAAHLLGQLYHANRDKLNWA